MSYEVMDHTADAKFRATGGTVEDAFSESVKAFAEIVGSDPESGSVRHSVELEAENQEALLFDFLDRLVFIQDTENVAVTHAEDLKVRQKGDDYSLEATIWVTKIADESAYLDIKAPTYNEMEVSYEDGEGWIVQAVLDI